MSIPQESRSGAIPCRTRPCGVARSAGDRRRVKITHFPPAEVGMTDEDVAETIRLLRYQSGVDIPDDISGVTDPPP